MRGALILMATGAASLMAGCDDAAPAPDGDEFATPAPPGASARPPVPKHSAAPASRPPFRRDVAPARPQIDYERWEPRIADRQACLDRIARVAPEIPAEMRSTGIAFHCEVGPTMAIARRMAETIGRPVTRIAECGSDDACIEAYKEIHAEVMAGPAESGSSISGPETILEPY